jgi:50S ribosomal protein L16 3-hydroxylase
LKHFMLSSIEDNQGLNNYLTSFLSRFRLAHEPVAPANLIKLKKLQSALQNGAELLRNPWTRLSWIEQAGSARLYASGQAYDCSTRLAETLCSWEIPRIRPEQLDSASLQVLVKLINNGHLLLTSP